MAFRPTVIQNKSPDRPETELWHAEQAAAELEGQCVSEAERLGAAAAELSARLQQIRGSVAQVMRNSGPEALEVGQRLTETEVPVLDISDARSQALEARQKAVEARRVAGESARQVLQAYSAELTRFSSQLSADEAALSAVEKRAKDEHSRRAREAQAAQARAAAPAPESVASPPSPRPQASAPPSMQPRATAAAAPAAKGQAMGRREQPRVRMQAAVDLGSDSNFFTGFSTNISEGGLFVATVAHFDVGTTVDLHFTLPGGGKMDVRGVVRWTREVNDKTPEIFPGVGVQFSELSPEAAKAIHRFVAEREPMFFPD